MIMASMCLQEPSGASSHHPTPDDVSCTVLHVFLCFGAPCFASELAAIRLFP